MKKGLLSIFAMAVLMSVSTFSIAQTTYTRVLSPSELEAGKQYLIVGFNNDGAPFVMGYQKSNNRHALPIEIVGDEITTVVAMDPNDQEHPYEFTLGGYDGEWTFFDPVKNGYLNAPGGGNYLRTQTTLTNNGRWTIRESETDDGLVPVSRGEVDQCIMRYNITSTLFGCYSETSSVSATVYLFKAGSANVMPEPSYYPEEFAADVDENSVTLTWTSVSSPIVLDARAYLVVGSTGNIPVPVDGVPVANDLNAGDGHVAYNVLNDGSDTFTFDQLPGNSTFHFAIFPYNNTAELIDYKTDGNYPTAHAVIGDTYVLLQSNFAQGLEPFEAINFLGEQTWSTGTYDGVPFAKMNGYLGGTTYANEDWLITPDLFAMGNYETATLHFMNAAKFEGNPLLVKISSDYNGDGNPQDYTWTDITNLFEWSEDDYVWVTTEAPLPVTRRNKLYVAFIYICDNVAATAWEIADVKVKATGYDAVGEHVATSVGVYPNPARETVVFTLANDAQVSVFDMTGRMVGVMNLAAGEARYSVAGFESGVYFLNIRYADGKTEVARFVKF